MYFCCNKKGEVLSTGRGKNKKYFQFKGLEEAIKNAKEYSSKNDVTVEIFVGLGSEYNQEKDKKIVAYKKGQCIYFNIR